MLILAISHPNPCHGSAQIMRKYAFSGLALDSVLLCKQLPSEITSESPTSPWSLCTGSNHISTRHTGQIQMGMDEHQPFSALI